jgi:hypothetical protein
VSLDWIPGDPAPDRPERPSRKCYRHAWSKDTIPSTCLRCGKPYEPPKRKPDPRPGTPEYRAAVRAVETKAYRWLLARLGLR